MFAIFMLPKRIARRTSSSRFETLIQTDRRANLTLQFGELLKHRPGKRLLKHHQAEIVERLENVDVGQVVRSVRIDKERDVAEGLRTARTSSTSRPRSILIFTRLYPSARYRSIVRSSRQRRRTSRQPNPDSTGFGVAAEQLTQAAYRLACASMSQNAVSMPALAKLLPAECDGCTRSAVQSKDLPDQRRNKRFAQFPPATLRRVGGVERSGHRR